MTTRLSLVRRSKHGLVQLLPRGTFCGHQERSHHHRRSLSSSAQCHYNAHSFSGRAHSSAPRFPKSPYCNRQLSFRSFASTKPRTDDKGVLPQDAAESTTTAARQPAQAERQTNADLEPSVEEQYSRKTPLEHVLLRPGMYVGPNERLPPETCWVLETTPPPPTRELLEHPLDQPALLPTAEEPSSMRMVQRQYGLVPALVKVFDEIMVNASDNRLRHPKTCTRIDVVIDPGDGNGDRPPYIRVVNDGKGIPVQIHKKEKMYVPEMLFGHLLTGSNFDDTQKRITGGRHGYGAKLANIFSESFTVETFDSRRGLRYRQTWSHNMTQAGEPEIERVSGSGSDYTSVSFVPDLARLTGNPDARTIESEDYAVMCRRVVDVAGCASGGTSTTSTSGSKRGLHVTLNGMDVSQPSFADYCQMYRSEDAGPLCFETINARWTVGVGVSESSGYDSVSFVNGMTTSRGGTHVGVIVQQISKRLREHIDKLEPELKSYISEAIIKRHLFVCCNAKIENPTFDSQMKEYLTSSPQNFGSSYELSKSFFSKLCKSKEKGGPGLVEEIIEFARGRQQATLIRNVGGSKKSKRQVLAIPKLDDAHQAGTKDFGRDCTIILTEGDSAKALAIAGLEVVGRDRFGVFPLRGKFLNVRHATVAQMKKNEEVKSLCAILGLDFGKKYETMKERHMLRYGRVMLMTDQDTDGTHIKGLVLNFFRHFWPALLMPPIDQPTEAPSKDMPFFASFVTPLLKASKKGNKDGALAFYSMPEYIEWRTTLDDKELKKWKVKYYKGLGTSTPSEAKEYFAAFSNNLRPFRWKSDTDGEYLDMVFDKERASERKDWILDEYDKEASITVDPALNNEVSYEDFVNKELIHFSHADNIRSIPSAIDGLKPSQRKVLYACFKRNLKAEIKVAQLTGYCAEHTAYHHGETSLQSTIIGMAQNFVGSNNLNLLEPSGQFGTRLVGGTDAASPRYIFTQLAPVARLLFPEDDDALLTYREDDGQLIEPEFYAPVLPLLLINGSQGIGTGWSTSIPAHSPTDVLNYIQAKLDNEPELPPIRPYTRGFEGKFQRKKGLQGYISVGRVSELSKTSVLIDELPVKVWTESYKEKTLLKMREKGSISGILENHTTSKVSFTVNFKSARELSALQKKGLESALKLKANLPTSNMHAFDADCVMTKFETPEDIVEAYFPVRMALYEDRKSVLESEMSYNTALCRNRARFIELVIAGEIDLVRGKKSKRETITRLEELNFLSSSMLDSIRNDNAPFRRWQQHTPTNLQNENDNIEPSDSTFDYLLNMPLSSLTAEKIAALQEEAAKKEQNLELTRKTTASDLWKQDLDRLEPFL